MSAFKIKPKHKKYVRLVAAIIILALGAVFMVVPFIPLGYIFIFAGLLLLSYYVPPIRKWVNKFKKKDDKNRLDKIENKIDDTEKKVDEKIVDDGEKSHTTNN